MSFFFSTTIQRAAILSDSLYEKCADTHCPLNIYFHGRLQHHMGNSLTMGAAPSEGIHSCHTICDNRAIECTEFIWLDKNGQITGLVVANNDYPSLKYAAKCYSEA